MDALKVESAMPRRVVLRRCKYLNNVIAQDHRTVKKPIWAGRRPSIFQSAWGTWPGIETVHMIRKVRMRWLAKGATIGHALFFAGLFGPRCLIIFNNLRHCSGLNHFSQNFATEPLDMLRFELRSGGPNLDTTTTKLEVLNALVRNLGRVLTRENLLEEVWGSGCSCRTGRLTITSCR